MTFCSGHWYPTGEAPCEVLDKTAAHDLDDLPECERADVIAAASLLGTTRCRFKPRGSWTSAGDGDIVIAPEKVGVTAQVMYKGLVIDA
jgi:hypothetical protein